MSTATMPIRFSQREPMRVSRVSDSAGRAEGQDSGFPGWSARRRSSGSDVAAGLNCGGRGWRGGRLGRRRCDARLNPKLPFYSEDAFGEQSHLLAELPDFVVVVDHGIRYESGTALAAGTHL